MNVKIKLSAISVSLLGGNIGELLLEKLDSLSVESKKEFTILDSAIQDLKKKHDSKLQFEWSVADLIQEQLTVSSNIAMSIKPEDVVGSYGVTSYLDTRLADQCVHLVWKMGWVFVLNYRKWESGGELVLYFEVARETDEYELLVKIRKGLEV